MTFGVYVHYPYCARLCPYCDFNVAVRREVPHARYADAVCEEIRVRAPDFSEQGAATTVYFGGGTPGMWPSEYIGQVLEKIDATAGIDPNAEITVEFNPEDATIERFRALKAVGVNRVSLGIQSFDDRVLNRLGRQHSGVTAQRSVDIVRRAGIDNLSIDLIHGLAEHPVEAALRDVERAVQLGPEHISTYQLTIEDKTAFGARARRGESLLISDEHLLDCFIQIRAALAQAGLEPYEISSAARPGYRSQHNQLYWRGAPFLAAGAGAHGFWRGSEAGRRWENERNPARYMEAALAGEPRVTFEEQLDAAALIDDDLMMGLRADDGIELTNAMYARFSEVAEELIAEELLVTDGIRWATSDRGRLVLDTILVRMLSSVS